MIPRVSVIIPCFNLGRFLDDAVDSALTQSFSDLEILIVDDGSTDEATRALLAGYDRPRTRVVRTANHGLPSAKNTGIAETRGEFICALDADDRLEPRMIEKSVGALDADPSLAFVSHWVRHFGDEHLDWTPTDCGFPALLDVNTVNGAALVRRKALAAVGGFDVSFARGCEDWDLWISMVELGHRGAILPEVLHQYRRRSGSMSRTMKAGEGHSGLYRQLVQKHSASFRTHLPALIGRRERDLAAAWRNIHDLALEDYRWMQPELAKARDDVGVTELQPARVRQQQRERNLRDEVRELRGSLSWRVTAPLRAVYSWVLWLGQRWRSR
jgi:glycosyltransferase involved in cell wall biosynthesis